MSSNIGAKLKLDVWKGDWGLPSIDVDCLRFMTYIKFSGLDCDINSCSNPFWTPEGQFPVLRLKSANITSYDELEKFIIKKNCDPDVGLSNKEKAEIVAITSLLQEKLYPALQYVWWVDQKNLSAVIKPWYGRTIPFPFCFYYPTNMANKAQNMITTLYEHIELEKDIETKVYGDAEKCLTTLSVRLGERNFMFGDHPRSIDAIIFAYLAPLLKAPLQSTVLQNHLKACTNLHKFVSRINQRYYFNDYHDYENKKKEEHKTQQHKDVEFPHKIRNQFLAIIFASIAMFTFAFQSGIVESEPSVRKQYSEDDLYEDEKKEDD